MFLIWQNKREGRGKANIKKTLKVSTSNLISTAYSTAAVYKAPGYYLRKFVKVTCFRNDFQ